MRCVYCNAENGLTSSDIITYAITGAKLTKTFVCKKHNKLTNDMYEKKFIDDLNFFRNQLGLSTREGKPIQYIADISVNGTELHNVKVSNRESLYAPKGVVTGVDNNGNKVLLAPMEKLDGISKGKATIVDMSDVTVHKTVTSDSFLGIHAVHTVAKIAYEWYCYINNIEEYIEDCKEIVDYILGGQEGNFVDVVVDKYYYDVIDRLSEIGTNTLVQYDEIDGYRYVIFDLWKTIAYRVRIGKSPTNNLASDNKTSLFKLYLYHIDGSKSQTEFGMVSLDSKKISSFITIRSQDIDMEMWRVFVGRLQKIISTRVLSIYTLKREVDLLALRMKRYDKEKMDVARLLRFEDDNVVTIISIIGLLYLKKDKYDKTKSFNQNLRIILKVDNDIITRTQKEKRDFLISLMEKDRENQLSEYIWNGINTFYEVYENEMKRE